MSKKRIHVNQHNIRKNKTEQTHLPIITIKSSKGNVYANRVRINGPSEMIYSPDKPLSCGARCWLETTAEVVVID